MKSSFQKTLLSLFLITLVAASSCKKDLAYSEGNEKKIALVNDFLAKQQNSTPTNLSNNIVTLQKHLVFSDMHEEENERGSTLVIPIDNEFRSLANISGESILNLVSLVNKDGTIKNMYVAIYSPIKKIQRSQLPQNTFHNIFHTASDIQDGKYRFLTPAGTRQYELEYKNGYLYSEGRISKGPSSNLIQSNATTKVTSNITRLSGSGCIDWYLVTTIRDWSGKIIDQYEEFVGSTCGPCGDGSFESLCSSEADGKVGVPIAGKYTKLWQAIVEPLTEDDGFGIYKPIEFTVESELFCTNLGLSGDITASNSAPKGLKIEQTHAEGSLTYAGDKATTTLKVVLSYANDPVLRNRTGYRTWSVAQMIK
ncbi:MAG: hypothetical protein NTZ47_01790 [Bacteroidetes bacterium]|nr:hypothetical protein [Bacteroidota bacterium]